MHSFVHKSHKRYCRQMYNKSDIQKSGNVVGGGKDRFLVGCVDDDEDFRRLFKIRISRQDISIVVQFSKRFLMEKITVNNGLTTPNRPSSLKFAEKHQNETSFTQNYYESTSIKPVSMANKRLAQQLIQQKSLIAARGPSISNKNLAVGNDAYRAPFDIVKSPIETLKQIWTIKDATTDTTPDDSSCKKDKASKNGLPSRRFSDALLYGTTLHRKFSLSPFRLKIRSPVILHRAIPRDAGCSIHTKKRRRAAPRGTTLEDDNLLFQHVFNKKFFWAVGANCQLAQMPVLHRRKVPHRQWDERDGCLVSAAWLHAASSRRIATPVTLTLRNKHEGSTKLRVPPQRQIEILRKKKWFIIDELDIDRHDILK
uniref:Uncharacterized protein n=1 Tax=Romanomermis culicivorax TaxID=13658 RepID=A0A915K2H6_ROMCU